MACLHWGPSDGSELSVEGEDGHFGSSNGQGGRHRLHWSREGLVALALDKVQREDRRAERLFEGAPPNLAPLVRAACDAGDRVGTAAFWVASREGGKETWGSSDESDQLAPYEATAQQAMRGLRPGLGWLELASLSAAHGRLAMSLARSSEAGASTIGESQEAVLLSPPPGRAPAFEAMSVLRAVERLAQAGITWLDAVAHAARFVERAQERRREADVDRGNALLEAVESGDLAAVEELLRQGANLEKRSRAGQLAGAIVGRETPLLAATRKGHDAIARALIAHGANVNALAGAGFTPLGNTIMHANAGLCRVLLDRGADPKFTTPNGDPGEMLEEAAHPRGVALIGMLLDAGTPLPRTIICEHLARLAEEQGRMDLVARLLPGGGRGG